MGSERPFLSHFSPQWTDPGFLEAILVQRGDLLTESVATVRDSVLTDRRRHLLFIGPRGAGKTHLVTLIQHRLRQDPALADRLRVAWLNEDETATSFLRLLIAIYRSLSERYPDEFPAATLAALAGKDPDVAREQLTRDLLQQLQGRVVVCLMENLDRLFRSLSVAELRNWRAFLQNHPVIVTVGTAQALFDGIADHDEPFFGFFDTRHLQPLSADDARGLLERIATLQGRTDLVDFLRTPTGRARVDAIRSLAGGNPRLYLIFSDLLVNAAALDDLVRPFEEMVDRQLTSYYQERLRWLSPQQQEIVQFLCRANRPVPVKQIAEGLFTTHNSITGQLKQLREFRYVDSRPLGREVFYELAEPLMRLALQVKETHDRRPLALIVDFLRIWHEQSELAERPAGEAGRTGEAIVDYTQAIELPGARPENVAEALNNRALSAAEQDEHEMVLRALDRLFSLGDVPPAPKALALRLHHKATEVVHAAFAVTTDAARWTRLLTDFAAHFSRFGGLTQLGEAAVKHLPTLAASPLNHAAWDAWLGAWETARAALPEKDENERPVRDQLDIPLRLLRAGIGWLKTKDDAHLLTLPREERRLLREALKLPPEK